MKLFKFFILSIFLLFGICLYSDEIRSRQILDERGCPTPLLHELLKALDVENDGSLDGIVKATQKKWVQSGKERWEFDKVAVKDEQATLAFLNAIGCIDTIRPKKQFYNYVFVLGATARRVQTRLEFLLEEWNQGLRFDHLVFLTGQRHLDPRVETLPAGIEYESEMMQFLFNKSNIPEEMKHIPLQIIDTPAIEMENGKTRRPGTKDTIIEWLKSKPKPGFCLLISNQPYVGYQDAVCRTEMPTNFIIETIGPRSAPETTFAEYLDNLARWLYYEQLRLSK